MKKLLFALSLSFPLLATTEVPKDVSAPKEVVAKIKLPRTKSEKLARVFMIIAKDTASMSGGLLVLGYLFGVQTPAIERLKWGAIAGALAGTVKAVDDFLSEKDREIDATVLGLNIGGATVFTIYGRPETPQEITPSKPVK